MLKDKIEKNKKERKNYPNQPELICQICNPGHEIEITP
jgi:hypothetical protein